MTKKHFIEMAKAFNKQISKVEGAEAIKAVYHLVEAFIRIAKKANPRFDEERFWIASGFEK